MLNDRSIKKIERLNGMRKISFNHHFANMYDRTFAFLLDIMITMCCRGLIVAIINYLSIIFKIRSNTMFGAVFAFLFILVVVSTGIIYRVYFLIKHQATIGMRVMKIKLIECMQEELSIKTILTREIFFAIHFLILGFGLFMIYKSNYYYGGFLLLIVLGWWQMSDFIANRAFLHDFLSGSQVIHVVC